MISIISTFIFIIPIIFLLVNNLLILRSGYSILRGTEVRNNIVCIVIICIAWIMRECTNTKEKYDQIVAGTVYEQLPTKEDEYSNGLGWIL